MLREPTDQLLRDPEMSPARMSVVLVTDNYETIRLVVARLAEQTVQGQLELVIVGPSGRELRRDTSALGGFAGVRVVELDDIQPMARARAAGVRVTTAPVVFLGETHSFPHPGFAAALIGAHEKPWDIVVPGISNANPDGALSWAAFLMDYGQWLEELPAGEIVSGPTWNTSYKRSVLVGLDGALDRALSSGDELSITLRARGCRAWFEPAARISHMNVGRRGWVDERFLSGLLIGAHRRGLWSPAKRLAYICASPLIPVVILSRIARSVRVLARRGALPSGTVPALLLGAIVRTAGEVVGYIRGASSAEQTQMEKYELHKVDYVGMPRAEPSAGS